MDAFGGSIFLFCFGAAGAPFGVVSRLSCALPLALASSSAAALSARVGSGTPNRSATDPFVLVLAMAAAVAPRIILSWWISWWSLLAVVQSLGCPVVLPVVVVLAVVAVAGGVRLARLLGCRLTLGFLGVGEVAIQHSGGGAGFCCCFKRCCGSCSFFPTLQLYCTGMKGGRFSQFKELLVVMTMMILWVLVVGFGGLSL